MESLLHNYFVRTLSMFLLCVPVLFNGHYTYLRGRRKEGICPPANPMRFCSEGETGAREENAFFTVDLLDWREGGGRTIICN